MGEKGPMLDENTLQLYRDYVGITDPHELKLHLIHVQSRLVKVKSREQKIIVFSRDFINAILINKNGKIHYRCIEQFKFASSRIYHRFFYQKIIRMAQNLDRPFFLDIGCCTGLKPNSICGENRRIYTNYLLQALI